MHAAPAVAGFTLALVLITSAAAAAAAGLTDTVDLADEAAGPARRVAVEGDVRIEPAGDVVGGHDLARPGRVLRGAGSSIAFHLEVAPGRPLTLEFEELHGRNTGVTGYLVFVDGRKVALRTWHGCGAGPVHHFVQVPAPQEDQVTVRLVSQLDAPVAVTRVWAFSGFDEYVASNGLSVPLFLAPTIRLGEDAQADLARLRDIRTSFDRANAPPGVRAAWTTWLPYANLTDAAIRERIDYILRLAAKAGMPVQICFDTWWAHTPGGSDGRGGFWTDVPYQQVVWNDTRRQFQLSIPNRWSSTPWLSVNHPDLLAYKTRRLRAATSILRELTSDGPDGPANARRSRRELVLAVNLDNEPVYWASGNAGLGGELLMSDFNPHAIDAAKRDGVTLDPADGLSRDERFWLARNLLNYHTAMARAALDGLGRPAGDPNPLRNNVYTQAMVANAALQYPMLDAGYPFWETAAPAGVRVGGEWNGGSVREREAVLHQIALGRNAAVNAECGNRADDVGGVPLAYATGQRYWAGYNYPLDQLDVAAATVKDLSQPLPSFRYLPVVLEHRFTDDAWQQHVADHGGLQVSLIGNTTAMAAAPASSAGPGFLTYKLDAPAGGAWDGLFLELSGRAFVSRRTDDRVHVRVLAGATPEPAAMREVGRFHDTGDINAVHRFDLGDVARGRETAYARVELHAPGLPPSVLTWCSVYHVRFTRPWPAIVTEGLPPQDESLATQRRQNGVVSWRRDAELAIAELGGSGASEPLRRARAEYEQGAYLSAYDLANLALATTRPATAAAAREIIPTTRPRTLAGTLLGAAGGRISLAPAAADGTEQFVVAPAAVIERGESAEEPAPATLRDLGRGDAVEVDLDADGAVTAIRARAQTIRGRIAEFSPVTPTAMPTIRLAGDAEARIVDLNAPVHLGDRTITPRTTQPSDVRLAAGDEVTLRAHPVTGRVFEVWKR